MNYSTASVSECADKPNSQVPNNFEINIKLEYCVVSKLYIVSKMYQNRLVNLSSTDSLKYDSSNNPSYDMYKRLVY